MKTLKGPGIFLAQFIGAEPPFDKLETMAQWVASMGYVGVQMPTGGADSFFDLARAAQLVDARGKPQGPLAWEGDPPGGHHRRGVLRFRPPAGNPATVELRILDVGGVAVRTFRWSLR